MKQSFGPFVRGTLLGAFFGVLPGTTPAIASFGSYMVEKKIAKDPSRFGRGAMRVSGGDPSVFVTRPITLAFIIATAALLVVMVLPAVRAGRNDITG